MPLSQHMVLGSSLFRKTHGRTDTGARHMTIFPCRLPGYPLRLGCAAALSASSMRNCTQSCPISASVIVSQVETGALMTLYRPQPPPARSLPAPCTTARPCSSSMARIEQTNLSTSSLPALLPEKYEIRMLDTCAAQWGGVGAPRPIVSAAPHSAALIMAATERERAERQREKEKRNTERE